ncbi:MULTISPECIES: FGGY family carbohydrate kinase [unclassified Mesorhizobium]|uniref:FGGY-family carbohydrate kinase n=1 Tax=unclassified Mesorhizobium TaxID=325217 RepID=UPI001FED9CA6|nr:MULTISPECIES: FGGY family carbohydrate kinase [unclassified Mesorhizobium]
MVATMGIITVDLGTTNIKVGAYTDNLTLVALESSGVSYLRKNTTVEFDAEHYLARILDLVAACYRKAQPILGRERPVQLVLTGQAESLIVADESGRPLRNGISWLDMRSQSECDELSALFDRDTCYRITGQPEIIPTWPLTKLLWIKHNEPECFGKARKLFLLKDYVIYHLTGQFVGEHSIYPFSHYFDVTRRVYWEAPLRYCSVEIWQLPKLIEPCSIVGEILPGVRKKLDFPTGCTVNSGTLDHFAGMIGTGNIAQGIVSESAGTVSSIATIVEEPFASSSRIPLYCGPFADSYIYLPVCESGGISLEWFRKEFVPGVSFGGIDAVASKKEVDRRLTFLPYLTGVNPPEFDRNATGVFFGVTVAHDSYDFALAIMYGVACLLRKNIDNFRAAGIGVEKIISTGGGAKSSLWSQIKANICGLPVAIPADEEAPSLGAAIIGAVTAGEYASYGEAASQCVKVGTVYDPESNGKAFEKQYQLFRRLYDSLGPVFKEFPANG